MEERMMNIVSLIAGHVQTRQELFSNEGTIMDELMHNGYRLQEANAAIMLMQSLARDAETFVEHPLPLAGMRTMSTEERNRFTLDAFGLVTKLTALGVIAKDQREELIEQALSLHRGRIGLVEIKTLLALNLFGDAADYEKLFFETKDHCSSAWH